MPDFMLTGPEGTSYKLTTPDGVTHEDAERELARTMTHQAEQPNPARPVIDAAKAFATGGLQGVANKQGVATPAWSQRAGEVLTSPAANAALGMINPIKGAPTFYMGTQEPFALDKLATTGANRGSERAIFLAPTEKLARDYGNIVTPISVNAKNPKTIDWRAREGVSERDKNLGVADWYNEGAMAHAIDEARAQGHDVLYIENIVEPGTWHGPHTQAAVLDPSIIETRANDPSDVLRGASVQMPQASNAIGDLLKSNAANTAIGMTTPIKSRLPQPPSVQRPNRPINQATLDEMRATPNSAPPLDPRPINPETLAEMRANEPLGNGPLAPIDPLSK